MVSSNSFRNKRTDAVLLAMLLFIATLPLLSSFSFGPNYNNVSVDATVNITESLPDVLGVTINAGSANVTLNAGALLPIECNASIRDFNGGGTISNVTAVFFDSGSATAGSPDDNNDHYTNASCSAVNVNGIFANFTCNFDIEYYSNNETWICNVTATDTFDFNGSDQNSNFNTTIVDPLLALNVTSPIDYGNLAVFDTSDSVEANVTNIGNIDINVSVYGYGSTPGDGLAMVCDVGNISIENQRYGLIDGEVYASMTSLTGSPATISGFGLPQQTNDVVPVINSTYWKIFVPPNPFGRCNGTIVFQAENGE